MSRNNEPPCSIILFDEKAEGTIENTPGAKVDRRKERDMAIAGGMARDSARQAA